MATIARETGWTRRYILWQLPYAAGLGMVHSALLHHGETVQWTHGGRGTVGAGTREEMRADLQTARERWRAEQAAV